MALLRSLAVAAMLIGLPVSALVAGAALASQMFHQDAAPAVETVGSSR